ncbi:hypothetical protein SCANM63S_03249 [Streptomyces canarius]
MPWLLTAKTPAALAGQAAALLGHLDTHPGLDPSDIGWTLATTRARFPHRASITGADTAELRGALAALADGGTARTLAEGTAPGRARPVFVFPGQGSQWPGMATELLEQSPVFAARMTECAAALAPYTDWDFATELRGDLDRVDRPAAAVGRGWCPSRTPGARTASPRPPSSATPRARSPPPARSARCPWRTAPASSPCGPGPSPNCCPARAA